MKAVNEYLKQIGLSEIESKLYLGLLEMGSTTVMELANHVGLKRITAHFNVESLITKGLVTETRKGARRQIVAEEPEKLETLVIERENEITQLKQNLPSIIQTISAKVPKVRKENEVEIRYYEGKKAVFGVYMETIKSEEFYSFADYDNYYATFPGTVDMWNKEYSQNEEREVWDIVVETELSRKVKDAAHSRHHIKFLPKGENEVAFKFSDYIIFDNKVAIIELDPHHPTATIISSRQIAMSLKVLHKSMWMMLRD